jgi:transposase
MRVFSEKEKWIETLTEQQRKAIRFASIDMWAPYFQAVRNKLPRAQVVVDRFHVMKQLNERIGKIRTRIQSNADDEVMKILKGSRWLLVRNRSGLSSKEQEHLHNILDLCAELRTVYLLKEEFRQIFKALDATSTNKKLNKSHCGHSNSQ